jgi:hypothetical protein
MRVKHDLTVALALHHQVGEPLGPRCSAQLTGIALRLSRDAVAVAPSVMGIVRGLPLAGCVIGASLLSSVTLTTVNDRPRRVFRNRNITPVSPG